jgi:hypothetical protein
MQRSHGSLVKPGSLSVVIVAAVGQSSKFFESQLPHSYMIVLIPNMGKPTESTGRPPSAGAKPPPVALKQLLIG